ncbi:MULTISPECIES: HEPN domain-containing protein [Arsenicicoccus]|uniref:ApeA N-terminal domain 1-containing protein n=1 Tax=Arsenicicoccus TaxID=267408 RepID=UPI00257FF16C|nr:MULTISPECIES: HEPN domain-containing protein [Arsenicicoccus]
MAEDRSTRIGFLADGDPGTEMMSALYEYDTTGVRLHVPFLSKEDPRSRWWSHGVLHGDDPDRTKYRYQPPSELDYADDRGTVALLGCVSGRANTAVFRGVGRGTVRACYAVEGARSAAHYKVLNGFRSEIDGLGHWLGLSAHETIVKVPKDGGGLEITTTLKSVDALPLARRMNLRGVVSGTGPGAWSPDVAYTSRVFIETFTKSPAAWRSHVDLHSCIRNLVRVAAWKPINFQAHLAANVLEDVERDGEACHQWREVRTATTGIAEGVWIPKADRFLFRFSDIGARGVSRWLQLATRYSRGIVPFVGLLDLEGATVDAFISQLGIALEAVGYEALTESGKSESSANKTNVSMRIDHLLSEVAGDLSFSTVAFGRDFADSYNSVKHANRPTVAPDVKVEHLQQGVELLRVWIARRIGVRSVTLAESR